MKLRFVLCCETNILDATTNRVSCINLLEDLLSPQFPIILPLFSALAVFDKEEGNQNEESAEIIILLDEEELARAPILVNFVGSPTHRTLMSLQGFVVPAPGLLSLSIVHQDNEVGRWNIRVRQAAPDLSAAVAE